MNKKVPLYSTGNYVQYPVINHSGKEYKINKTIITFKKRWDSYYISESVSL